MTESEVDLAAIVHHWNKSGEGSGPGRMAGVGPQEWGRVLCSGNILSKSTDPYTRISTVNIAWSFEGDELADTTVRTRRRVWTERPDDLDSPLRYELAHLADDATTASGRPVESGLRPAARRVLGLAERLADSWDTGSAVASLTRELRAATAGAIVAASPLEQMWAHLAERRGHQPAIKANGE